MKFQNVKNIGLYVSGGGYRAAIFHLGMLTYLADQGALEKISFISSVSGGSLLTGLIFKLNNYKWPSSHDFREMILAPARVLFTTTNLQVRLIADLAKKSLFLPSLAAILANRIKKDWGINEQVNELPVSPRWIINATSSETGRSWRFERKRMGDYMFGYSREPDFPLSTAMAASASLPFVIGPTRLRANRYAWFEYVDGREVDRESPVFDMLHLWDGGLYDNMGLEPLVSVSETTNTLSYRNGVDFLIVSNASLPLERKETKSRIQSALRVYRIPLYQTQALRTRNVVHHLRNNPNSGLFLLIGNNSEHILRDWNGPDKEELLESGLDEEATQEAAHYKTDLMKLSIEKFDLLFMHGYQTAEYTAVAHLRG